MRQSSSRGSAVVLSLLNFERSDEGRDVPWNGNAAQLCPRLSMGQDAPRLNTPA